MSRAEDAVMRLYEDASLRGDLTDEPADRLLKWAEDKLIELDESGVDDAAFEAGAEAILESVKQINRTVGDTLSTGGGADFSAQAAEPDEMALVEDLMTRFDNAKATGETLIAMASAADEAIPAAPIPPEELPHLNIALNPALTSFFTGQPAPAEPAAEDTKEEPEPSPSDESAETAAPTAEVSDEYQPESPAETPPEAPPAPEAAPLNLALDSVLTRFFTGQPAPAEPAAEDSEDETDADDARD